MYLLDTNILTALHTGNYKVINAIKQLEDPNIAITIITKVELIQGRISFLLKATNGQDLLIASIALANRATLVTRNTKDFQNIPNLKLANWIS
jgi:tRNA(fMet)-specific endonuclease VapC